MGTQCNCLKDDKDTEYTIGRDEYSFKKMVCKNKIKNFYK